MTPELLRSLWSLIELLPPDTLVTHDQDSYINLLINQLMQAQSLEHEQIEVIRAYIKRKIPLICELNDSGRFSQNPYLSA